MAIWIPKLAERDRERTLFIDHAAEESSKALKDPSVQEAICGLCKSEPDEAAFVKYLVDATMGHNPHYTPEMAERAYVYYCGQREELDEIKNELLFVGVGDDANKELDPKAVGCCGHKIVSGKDAVSKCITGLCASGSAYKPGYCSETCRRLDHWRDRLMGSSSSASGSAPAAA